VIRLVVGRLLAIIPTLFGVLVVAFLLLNVIPGDPVAEMVGERADSATIVRLRAELHLDEPVPAQFGHYLWVSYGAIWAGPTLPSVPSSAT